MHVFLQMPEAPRKSILRSIVRHLLNVCCMPVLNVCMCGLPDLIKVLFDILRCSTLRIIMSDLLQVQINVFKI